MILELPWPPSVNGYWRHVVMGKRAAVLLSAKGRDYRKAVAEYVGQPAQILNLSRIGYGC